jgi:hypothetical protein
MNNFLQKILTLGREYVTLNNSKAIVFEKITRKPLDNVDYESILSNADFSLLDETQVLDNLKIEFTDMYLPKVRKMSNSQLLTPQNISDECDIGDEIISYRAEHDMTYSKEINSALNKQESYEEIMLVEPRKFGLVKIHRVIPASETDEKKYNEFIQEMKNLELDDLEKIALIYSVFSKNKGNKNSNDLDEMFVHEDKDDIFGGLLQRVYAPATIFTGSKCGVCLDRSYALLDIYNKIGINASPVCAFIEIKGKLSDVGHIWLRIKLPETESLEFDLDNAWYKSFRLLKPRTNKQELELETINSNYVA